MSCGGDETRGRKEVRGWDGEGGGSRLAGCRTVGGYQDGKFLLDFVGVCGRVKIIRLILKVAGRFLVGMERLFFLYCDWRGILLPAEIAVKRPPT